jgi:hypothetical protein
MDGGAGDRGSGEAERSNGVDTVPSRDLRGDGRDIDRSIVVHDVSPIVAIGRGGVAGRLSSPATDGGAREWRGEEAERTNSFGDVPSRDIRGGDGREYDDDESCIVSFGAPEWFYAEGDGQAKLAGRGMEN